MIDLIVDDEFIRRDAWRHFNQLVAGSSDLERGEVHDLKIRDARMRCVVTILRLCGYRHSINSSADQTEFDLAQDDLAYLSNLSRNAVGLFLRELERQKLIEVSYRRLKVLVPEALIERVWHYEHSAMSEL